MLNFTRPYFWLLAYLVIMFLRPQEYVDVLIETPVVPASLMVAASVWLLTQEKRFKAPQHGLMLGLTATMGLSVLSSGWATGAVNVVTKFVPTLLVFYMVATSVDSIKKFKEICLILSAMSFIMAIHGMEQIANEEGKGWTGAATIQGRITYLGLLNDPNDLAMVFLMSLPLTLYLTRHTESFVMRQACYVAAAATVYGIYLCNSRGSILGLVAMLTLYVGRRFGMLQSSVVLPVLIGLLAIFAPSRSGDLSASEASAAGRVDAWYAGFEMFFDHPFFGVGAGLFTDHHQLTAHNSFVLALAEMGLAGYTCWFAILAVSAAMLWRLLTVAEPARQSTDPPDEFAEVADQLLQEEDAKLLDPAPTWLDIQDAAAALSYAYIGVVVTAFFLSRSYVVFLYLMVALVVAVYQLAVRHWPALVPVQLNSMLGPLLTMVFVSIGGLWLLTSVLLRIS